jgi:hypothetical protein
MARWMARSDHLFHTGGVLQPERFASTRTLVHLTPNAYCHIRFSEQERNAPPDDHAYDVAMIGNNVTRLPIPVPGLTGLPGGLPRWRLARTLAHTLGPDKFLLLGRDWPSRWSPGTVPFEGQAQALRSALVSVNWDHYSSYPAYSSDRLPIALIAGRPHVTTGHPGMDWAPDRSHGLFLEPDVAAVSRTALALASQPDRARSLGLAAWEWARHRISTREQARFMLSRMRPDIAEPPTDPWLSLPAPVAGSARDDWPR